jgi:hypothetical protein
MLEEPPNSLGLVRSGPLTSIADGYRTLREGERGSFNIGKGPKGPQAAKIVKTE